MKVGVVRGLTIVAAAVLVTAGCEQQQGEDPRSTPSDPPAASSAPPSEPSSAPPSTSFAPAPKQFDHTAMQDDVHQVLTEYHQVENLGMVICPPKRPVEKGTAFTCTAEIDGEERKVPIKVTSDDGDYKVGAPR